MRCWVSSLVAAILIKVAMVDVCREEREGPSWGQRLQKAVGEVGVLRGWEAWLCPVAMSGLVIGTPVGVGGGARSPCEFSPRHGAIPPCVVQSSAAVPEALTFQSRAPALAGDGRAQPVLV